MWEKAEHRRIDAFKLWCWRRLLRVPWTARRSNQSILKEINHEYSFEYYIWISEASILWPPEVKSQLPGKDPDAGKDWAQEEKGTTEDEMAGWHHRLNGHAFDQTPGDGKEQGSLACCSPSGPEESETTWQLKQQQRRYQRKMGFQRGEIYGQRKQRNPRGGKLRTLFHL